MAGKEKLKDIWAMTDEPLIRAMKKKPPRSSAALNNSSSSDTSSASTSDSDSDFSALPEEFRPNLNIETPCLEQKGNHKTINTGAVDKVTESRRQREKSNHSKQNFDINLNTNRKMDSSRDKSIGRSTTNTLLNKCKKKTLQYEYVQKQNMVQEPQLIRMKFDMHFARDTFCTQDKGLEYETREVPTASLRFTKNEVDDRIKKKKFHKKKGYNPKNDCPTSFETSNIKWDDSLCLKPEQNNKIKWNYVQIEKRVSFETFADNSAKPKRELVNRKKSSNKSENFCKFKNIQPNKMRIDPVSNRSNNCYPIAKNAELRTKDDKNATEFYFMENNLPSVNKSQIKYAYVSEQDFKEKEIPDPTRTYVKDNGNNRKQNLEDILNLSSLSKSINSVGASLQKPTNILQSEDYSHVQNGNAVSKPLQNIEEQRNCILQYGKEMSDLIIGSHTALSMLISFYREWTVARQELLTIFRQLEKNLLESSKTLSKYADLINVAKKGSDLATNVPHPAVAMTAKVLSIITGLLQTVLKSKKDQLSIDDSDKVTHAMMKDTQTTSELQMYVLQCSQQFEETSKFIIKFHSESKIQEYLDNQNPEITAFIKGFLEYKPDHRIFYKKLHKCFSELLQTSSTSLSISFCEPFTYYSTAIEVIEYLGWRFRCEDFDSTSVSYELEAISRLIQNENNTTIDELYRRIRNCVTILTEELDFRERCMKDISLFDKSTFSKKLF